MGEDSNTNRAVRYGVTRHAVHCILLHCQLYHVEFMIAAVRARAAVRGGGNVVIGTCVMLAILMCFNDCGGQSSRLLFGDCSSVKIVLRLK